MYQWIAKRQVHAGFKAISSGDYLAVTSKFTPDAYFSFAGESAMSANFRGRELAEQWFARVHRLFPDLQLTARRIFVAGLPWAMTVTTEFDIQATLPDGTDYRNAGVQILRIHLGKIVEDRLIEDTALLTNALRIVANSGNAEATAPPIH